MSDTTNWKTWNRAAQNTVLRQHGYCWHKVQDVFGPSDDGDNCGSYFQLYNTAGEPVTISQAFAAIAEEQAAAEIAEQAARENRRQQQAERDAYYARINAEAAAENERTAAQRQADHDDAMAAAKALGIKIGF